MGVRVHKIIGYGLTDIKHRKGVVKDPRINMDRIDALRYAEDRDDSEEFTVAKFYKWVICNRRRLVQISRSEGLGRTVRDHHCDEGLFLMHYLPRQPRYRGPARFQYLAKKDLSFHDIVTHDEECHPNIMVFQPFTCAKAWSRYDDIIDYVEETSQYDSRDRYRDLSPLSGIYPYIGDMIRFREPDEKLIAALRELGKGSARCTQINVDSEGLPLRLDGGLYNQLVGRWDKKQPPLAKKELLDHLLNDWRPRLPLELVWILTYMSDKGCFNDVEAIKNSLRPMLFVYWS